MKNVNQAWDLIARAKFEKMSLFWVLILSSLNGFFDIIGVAILIPIILGFDEQLPSSIALAVSSYGETSIIFLSMGFVFFRQFLTLYSLNWVLKVAYAGMTKLAKESVKGLVMSPAYLEGSIARADILKAIVNDVVMIGNSHFRNYIQLGSDLIVIVVLLVFIILYFGAPYVAGFATLFLLIGLPILAIRGYLSRISMHRQREDLRRVRNVEDFLDTVVQRIVNGQTTLMLDETQGIWKEYSALERKFGLVGLAPRMSIEVTLLASVIALSIVNKGIGSDVLIAQGLSALMLATRLLPILQRALLALQQIEWAKPALSHVTACLENADSFAFEEKILPGKCGRLSVSIPTAEQQLNRIGVKKNLELQTGTMTFLSGESGSGKTTFFHRLLGLRKHISFAFTAFASSGEQVSAVGLLNTNIRVGFVGQNGTILSGPVLSNFVNNLDGEGSGRLNDEEYDELKRLFSDLGLDQFISDDMAFLNFHAGEGGKRVSGGERQRLSLAATLFRKPDILLLDEPLSGLDEKNKSLCLNKIREYSEDHIVLIISHDERDMRSSDQIVKIIDKKFKVNNEIH